MKYDRQFDKQIFMGADQFSGNKCYQLHKILEEAISIIGGMQQPCHCLHPCGCDLEYKYDKECLEVKVKDICMALTGKEWEAKGV